MEILKSLVWFAVVVATMLIIEAHTGNMSGNVYNTEGRAATSIIINKALR